MRKQDLIEELWLREDGWAVTVYRGPCRFVAVSRLPSIVEEPPIPLTYGYVKRALLANGYIKVTID